VNDSQHPAIAKGFDVTTVAEIEQEAAGERAPTKAPKSSAAFKEVPQDRAVRDQIRAAVETFVKTLDKTKPLTKESTREMAEGILKTLGLDCKKCGACEVGDFRTKAEELGYKVLVSEGTPIVLKIIVSGHIDAIVGVACLNVLEKAFDKVLLAGIPCIATPLLSSNCKNTSVDNDWVFESIGVHTPPPDQKTKTYMHLMRAANALFEESELSRLVPRPRASSPEGDPLRKHENIAYDFLSRGGKRSRPFITLAAYDALKGAPATLSETGWELPDAVKRAAVAIESFHKASLVHDDIEDDDAYRYGHETLHRVHGVGTAINVGDYLIGVGYRSVSRDRKALGAETAADILDKLADAHIKLS
jgi:geranylgeranyl diphosphate synthase type II